MAKKRVDDSLNEVAVSALEKRVSKQYGRDARKYAVENWYFHTGFLPPPPDWKDPYKGVPTNSTSTAKKKPAAKKK